jgi:hypothetical protein
VEFLLNLSDYLSKVTISRLDFAHPQVADRLLTVSAVSLMLILKMYLPIPEIATGAIAERLFSHNISMEVDCCIVV